MPLTPARDFLFLLFCAAGAIAIAVMLGSPLIAAVIAASIAAAAVLAAWFGYRTRRRRQDEPGFRYVLVDGAGAVRELTTDEIEYLSRWFLGGDGAAPYIKNYYEARNATGGIQGFVERTRVPASVPIHQPHHSEQPEGDRLSEPKAGATQRPLCWSMVRATITSRVRDDSRTSSEIDTVSARSWPDLRAAQRRRPRPSHRKGLWRCPVDACSTPRWDLAIGRRCCCCTAVPVDEAVASRCSVNWRPIAASSGMTS